ncbi:hypothetical protein [Schinkia azotoformans]|uniref:hypothetical protein n=1 Tax=Schinkia azotoformans TaxID=1454 RepID=UPI002DBBDEAA|nr:hypothetical protein [Schinkia azotoformans]MEC1697778.1 hypothetical protein [Schinkia azotoformans]
MAKKIMTKELEYIENLKKTKPLTSVTYFENGGIVREYGTLDLEGLIKRLLQSKYITGAE